MSEKQKDTMKPGMWEIGAQVTPPNPPLEKGGGGGFDAWHSELKEPGYKEPDANVRECCLAVAFGDLDALRCDVHRGDFHGRYELKMNFCPHCGRDMKEYRRIVLKKLAEKYLVPE